MRRNVTGLLVGVLFALAGMCYVGSLFFDYNFTIFFDGWWTLFIIVPSFVSILSNGPRSFNIAALFVGVMLLLTQLKIIPSDKGEIIIATVILYIGAILIIHFIRGPRKTINNGHNYNINVNTNTNDTEGGANYQNTQNTGKQHKYRNSDVSDFPTYTAILTGIDSCCTSTNFEGARISAILGGADIDLRSTIITKDITIYVTAILGGVDILAPQNVRISVNNTDILGGTTCKAMSQASDAVVPLVTFITTTVMGGIDIT